MIAGPGFSQQLGGGQHLITLRSAARVARCYESSPGDFWNPRGQSFNIGDA